MRLLEILRNKRQDAAETQRRERTKRLAEYAEIVQRAASPREGDGERLLELAGQLGRSAASIEEDVQVFAATEPLREAARRLEGIERQIRAVEDRRAALKAEIEKLESERERLGRELKTDVQTGAIGLVDQRARAEAAAEALAWLAENYPPSEWTNARPTDATLGLLRRHGASV